MLVQCPSCQTTYRVSENAVTASKPTFRCSRCKNVFVLGAKAAAPRAAADRPPAAPRREAAELSFSFPAPERGAAARASHPGISDFSPAANGPVPEAKEIPYQIEKQQPEEKELSFKIEKPEKDWSIEPRRGAEETFGMKEQKPLPEFAMPVEQSFVFTRDQKPPKAEPEAPAASPDLPVSLTPYFLLCGVLLIFFSSFTLLYKTRPEPVESLLKALPWIGSSIVQNDYLREGIVLQTGRPRFQRIQGNKEVFLLSGVAVNRNRVKVREVKIEGYIYGGDGKVIERQVITIGNAISSKIVRDLTDREIADLQKQGPVKRFEILPDESVAFSIVFLKQNAALKTFGYRVLSAEEA